MNLARLDVGDIELHYLEKGSGDALIFVHGGLQDYRQWLPQIDRFAQQYRVVTFSRRYNYPNVNRPIARDHSAYLDAQDLLKLMRVLSIEAAHLVGHSYGAYGALFAAVEHPERVRSLVVSEPPVHRWLLDDPQHAHLYHEMITQLRDPVAEAFKRGDIKTTLQLMSRYFIGPGIDFGLLPPEAQSMFHDNLAEWEALMTSSDAFPPISRDRVRTLKLPMLLLTGDRTLPIHRAVNDHLEAVIGSRRRVTFKGASHNMWIERRAQCEELTHQFLKEC